MKHVPGAAAQSTERSPPKDSLTASVWVKSPAGEAVKNVMLLQTSGPHWVAATSADGVKPEPATVTVWPSTRPVVGVTVIVPVNVDGRNVRGAETIVSGTLATSAAAITHAPGPLMQFTGAPPVLTLPTRVNGT